MDKWEKAHWKRVQRYAKELDKIYDTALKEAAKIGASIKPFFKLNKPLNFGDYPQASKQLQKLINEINNGISRTIENGITLEWEYSNQKNDEVLKTLFGEKFKKLSRDQQRRYFSTNGKALDAFLKREDTAGLNLSDKVWRYTNQFKMEIEMGLDLGIRDGVSSAKMATELKKYLQHPDKLFRRVKDEHGVLQLSKNALAYHPGQGVYRSSYKNALRLARTETNMAYRSSDHERWKQMDFVKGIEIKLSNNHTCNGIPFVDMCDDLKGIYPKTFKFTGWHPNCRCYAVPVFAQSFDDFLDGKLTELETGKKPSKQNQDIKDVPQNFKAYIEKNKDRLDRAMERGTLPYYIRDNFEVGNGGVLTPFDMKPSTLELAKQRQALRTPAEIQAIKHAWNERRAIRKYGNSILNYMDGVSDVDTSVLQSALNGGDLSRIETEARKLKDIGKKILALDKLDNPMQVAKQFSMSEAITVNDSVNKKLQSWNSLSATDLKSKLEFEIGWVEKHQKYSTWKVAQEAYKKELVKVETKILWDGKSAQLQQIVGYKTKSPIYKNAILKATEAIKEQNVSEFDKWYKVADDKRNELISKKKAKLPKGSVFTESDFTQQRKDKAVWDKGSGSKADKTLIDTASSAWKRASVDEKDFICEYTYHYCNINEPLQGRAYFSPQTKTDFVKKVNAITSYIDNNSLPKDMWFNRGDEGLDVIASRIKFAGGQMPNNLEDLVGMEMMEGGFMSTASRKGKGFSEKSVIINIYAPKGTKAAYIEPVSSYGKGAGRNWDGVKRFTEFSNEHETLFQRGTKMRITKVYEENGRVYIDCEVIAQEIKDLSYVKDYHIGW